MTPENFTVLVRNNQPPGSRFHNLYPTFWLPAGTRARFEGFNRDGRRLPVEPLRRFFMQHLTLLASGHGGFAGSLSAVVVETDVPGFPASFSGLCRTRNRQSLPAVPSQDLY